MKKEKVHLPSYIRSLTKQIEAFTSESDPVLVSDAFDCAEDLVQDDRQKAGVLESAAGVAGILAEMNMDATTIAAGILFESLKGGDVPRERLTERFGEYVVFLVESLVKLEKIMFQAKQDVLAENFRKMLLAMGKDLRVIMIKFADRLYWMRHMDRLDREERGKYAQESLDIYAPLANRLGIGWLKAELEDLAFSQLQPTAFTDLSEKVAQKKASTESYIQGVLQEVREMMKEQGIQGNVVGRVKHVYGIYQKLLKQRISFDQVYDVVGLRIITRTKADCYAALGMLHSRWTPIPGRFKDFIGAPKSNLYQSVHTTVIGPGGERVEFQIRTEEMHRIAEGGIAAHWRYKEKGAISPEDEKVFSWLRDLIAQQKDLPNSREFLDAVRGDLFPDSVYVFTPRGDVKELPAGATPLDFAYSVHSEVGHHCTGARVNGRIVPLRYLLQNGDSIEVLTSQTQKPNRDWLALVHTSRAKNRIRQFLREEERKRSLELGTQLLERDLRRHGLSPKVLRSDDFGALGKAFGVQSAEDLIVMVGYGKLTAAQVVRKLLPEEPEERTPGRGRKRRKQAPRGIRISGVDDLLYHFSKCCFPIPGDEIVGFVTRGKGVSIHTADCPSLAALTVDEDRLITVAWQSQEGQTHPVKITAYTEDRPGILTSMSAAISELDVNVRHVDAGSTADRKAYANFVLEVRDRDQLDRILRKLSQVSGTISVSRVVRG